MRRTLTFNLNEMELREDSEQGRMCDLTQMLYSAPPGVCAGWQERLWGEEEEKPGRSCCDL